ncbi:hypothetical protein WA026_019307 [Henosepilachna vigintioctopunctata]|uniref:Uncharacterized protein n=1 Tax=Henosepilachna vigintioctopunctata TaxID=420089 RepID=A0AAW1UBW4_9CUCU
MFSRSSSLGSLDSIEQNSIHDDRSSVISDYSRITRGIISPSDLPDSPTQTIPPSPKPQKTSEFPINHKTTVESKSNILSNKVPCRSHVFEDQVTKFKEESTPMQLSTATSLSSLTIDDQDNGQIQGLVDNFKNEEYYHWKHSLLLCLLKTAFKLTALKIRQLC